MRTRKSSDKTKNIIGILCEMICVCVFLLLQLMIFAKKKTRERAFQKMLPNLCMILSSVETVSLSFFSLGDVHDELRLANTRCCCSFPFSWETDRPICLSLPAIIGRGIESRMQPIDHHVLMALLGMVNLCLGFVSLCLV